MFGNLSIYLISKAQEEIKDFNQTILFQQAEIRKRFSDRTNESSFRYRKHLILTCNQFLNKYRIKEAKERLKDPKESQYVVFKIALDVGFNSKSTFNTAFKKFTGMNPSQYREINLEETGPKS